MAQVAEHLPTKGKGLSSNPQYHQKGGKERGKEGRKEERERKGEREGKKPQNQNNEAKRGLAHRFMKSAQKYHFTFKKCQQETVS
jgi:hypothetical protein